MSLYLDSHQSCIRLKTGAGISAVPTADTVANGEVNSYNYIGHSQGFLLTISQGYTNAAQRPWLARTVNTPMPFIVGSTASSL